MLTLCLILSMMMPVAPDTADTLPHYPEDIQRVTVDGRSVAYVDRGAGPVLVLVHGLGSNLSLWNRTLDQFADTHRVLALDLPGFGLSEKDGVPATMPFFADAVAGFLDAMDVEQATYVGISMGGQVGMTFALEYPDRVTRMVLLSPAGIERFTEQDAAALTSVVTPSGVQNASDQQVKQNVQANFHTWSDDYAWLIEQRHALAQRSDFAAYADVNARAVAGMLNGPVIDRLSALDLPVLVLFGAGDKLIPNRFLHPEQTTASVAEAAREALPNATVEMVEDAGHLVMIEQPEAVHRAMEAFLNTAQEN